MKRIFCVAAMLIVASSISWGQSNIAVQDKSTDNDEAALKELIKKAADAVVHADLQKLEKFLADNFTSRADGISRNKEILLAELKSGRLKVAGWTNDDVRVSIRGNAAVLTGRSTLTNAIWWGKDFSGNWDWTDRFVKQRDGNWRVVSSVSKRIKQ